jgi:hypothetical protein
MSYSVPCGWCKEVKTKPGWHDCPQSIAGRKRLGDTLVSIDELMRGGQEKWDAPEDEARRMFTKSTFDKLEKE